MRLAATHGRSPRQVVPPHWQLSRNSAMRRAAAHSAARPGANFTAQLRRTMGVLPMMAVASGLMPGVGEAAMSPLLAAAVARRAGAATCCRGAAASRWGARHVRAGAAPAWGRLAGPQALLATHCACIARLPLLTRWGCGVREMRCKRERPSPSQAAGRPCVRASVGCGRASRRLTRDLVAVGEWEEHDRDDQRPNWPAPRTSCRHLRDLVLPAKPPDALQH